MTNPRSHNHRAVGPSLPRPASLQGSWPLCLALLLRALCPLHSDLVWQVKAKLAQPTAQLLASSALVAFASSFLAAPWGWRWKPAFPGGPDNPVPGALAGHTGTANHQAWAQELMTCLGKPGTIPRSLTKEEGGLPRVSTVRPRNQVS